MKNRDELFRKMLSIPEIDRMNLFSRVYGLMEIYEIQGKNVDTKLFFDLVEEHVRFDQSNETDILS